MKTALAILIDEMTDEEKELVPQLFSRGVKLLNLEMKQLVESYETGKVDGEVPFPNYESGQDFYTKNYT